MPAATPRLYFQTLFQHEVLRLYQHRTQAYFARVMFTMAMEGALGHPAKVGCP